QAVGILDADTACLFPRQPLRRQPMRAGDISQRRLPVGDIGEKEPRLERRMERVGMQLQLWIGRARYRAAADRLDVIERLASRARYIGQQRPPALEQVVQL